MLEYPKIKERLAALGILAVFVYIISKVSPYAMDWHLTYYPAARAFIESGTPYYPGSLLENPVWVAVFLIPFALFSEAVGRALFLFATLFAYYAAFQNAGLSRKWILLVFLSPQVLYGLNMGTIDAFVLAAPVLHPVLGFMVALSKPQIGIGYAVFLIIQWIREKDYKTLVLAVSLSGIGMLVSAWLGMPFSGRLIAVPWNTSLFPYSIPIGLAILFFAVKQNQKWWAMPASPMFSPYLTFHSWVNVFTVNHPRYLTIVFILSWAAYIVWHYINL